MRWLTLVILCVLIVSGCGPSVPSSTNVAPGEKPAQSGAAGGAPDRSSTSAVEGIRVTVDGQLFDISGDVQVTRQQVSGNNLLYIGKNPRPSALTGGGNGVLLELQTAPGKEGFSSGDVAIVTFTVWKGVEFSYISRGTMPGQPVQGLSLAEKSGKLTGSFESDLNGTLGKLRGRIDFGVVLPG